MSTQYAIKDMIQQAEIEFACTGRDVRIEWQIKEKAVTLDLIRGYRNMGAKRKPAQCWKVNGKRVAAAKLIETIDA
ncbi:MAG TPA: hypothetical protein VFM33_12865 [Aquabacterium sp.]|nr:hypothetical protein [Aquabacterium sp.]